MYPKLGMVFDPCDREIVSCYLPMLISCQSMGTLGDLQSLISFADVYSTKPAILCDLNNPQQPSASFLKSNQRFFFTRRQRISQKNENGKRPRRTLGEEQGDGGYWRSSTAERPIFDGNGNAIIGFVRALNFYEFKDDKKSRKDATKTKWLMYEYRLPAHTFQEWVVCKIKNTSHDPRGNYYDSLWLNDFFGISANKEDEAQTQLSNGEHPSHKDEELVEEIEQQMERDKDKELVEEIERLVERDKNKELVEEIERQMEMEDDPLFADDNEIAAMLNFDDPPDLDWVLGDFI